MSAYFIAAVGTDVGKTFTGCALLHHAGIKKIAARGYKPVISGWDNSGRTDTTQLIAAGAGGSIDDVSPWRFSAPLSPHRAAALEGKQLSLTSLVEWTREQAERGGVVLIETVGGVMVPLTDRHTTLEWMQASHLPAILVTGSYLGAISHTLTAMAALEQAGIPITALVMNETAGSTVTFEEAKAGLMPFLGTIPLRIFQPRVSSWREAREMAPLLDHLVGE